MKLSQVVPFGRGHAEYVRMLALSEADLRRRILACTGGLASVSVTAARLCPMKAMQNGYVA